MGFGGGFGAISPAFARAVVPTPGNAARPLMDMSITGSASSGVISSSSGTGIGRRGGDEKSALLEGKEHGQHDLEGGHTNSSHNDDEEEEEPFDEDNIEAGLEDRPPFTPEGRLDRFFEYTRYGSTIRRELAGGATTFFTMVSLIISFFIILRYNSFIRWWL
jgi:hypothetical protein